MLYLIVNRCNITFLGVVALQRLQEEQHEDLVDGVADHEEGEEGRHERHGQPKTRVHRHHCTEYRNMFCYSFYRIITKCNVDN